MLALVMLSPAVSVADTQVDHELARARKFKEYRVFHAGESFRRWSLTAAFRGGDARAHRGTFDFIYGDCTIGPGEESCSPPFEIQDYPACDRNLSSYPPDIGARPGRSIRGGTLYEFGYGRIELYTGNTTVVIWAPNDRWARRLVNDLEAADGKTSRRDRFDPPVPGALDGKLRCGR